jgi:hypothetical protein
VINLISVASAPIIISSALQGNRAAAEGIVLDRLSGHRYDAGHALEDVPDYKLAERPIPEMERRS